MKPVIVPIIVAALESAEIEVVSLSLTSNEVLGHQSETLNAYNRLVTAARGVDCW
jgi:hypothetical protein